MILLFLNSSKAEKKGGEHGAGRERFKIFKQILTGFERLVDKIDGMNNIPVNTKVMIDDKVLVETVTNGQRNSINGAETTGN